MKETVAAGITTKIISGGLTSLLFSLVKFNGLRL
jgi:hypothetical protein